MLEAQRIRVVVVDDHEMFADALVAALAMEPDVEVIGRAGSAAEAAERLAGIPEVDVVLMDHRLPDGAGTELAGTVRRLHPEARILLVTAATDETVLDIALRAGCAGYVSKNEPLSELVAALRAVHAGATAISPQMLDGLLERRRGPAAREQALTLREIDVLQRLARGEAAAQICAELNISANTMRNHTQRALAKLGAHSRLEAVTIALREGIVDLGRDLPQVADSSS